MTEVDRLLLECYEKHEKLICERAWKFAYNNEHRFEDLKSEGKIMLYHALNKYEPGYSKFSTFFYTVLTNHFIALQKRERRLVVLSDEEMPVVESKEEVSTFDYADMSHLSAQARKIYRLIKEQPTIIFKGTERNGRELKKALRNYLENMNWTRHTIDMTFHEMKEFIRA